jgi:hypothetical protein
MNRSDNDMGHVSIPTVQSSSSYRYTNPPDIISAVSEPRTFLLTMASMLQNLKTADELRFASKCRQLLRVAACHTLGNVTHSAYVE